jgi:cysteinyl-tRNA synthetase
MNIFNTESREKEEITSIDGNTIRMYTCGPTVYNFAHIGNLRTFVFEDLLRRALKYFGFQVIQARNITDIDDKTIIGALEKKIPLKQFTEPFTADFFEDLKTLNIEPVEHNPKATDYISQMVGMISALLKEGSAYRAADESIYFRINTFPSYGRLSHLEIDELKEGASGTVICDEYQKENASDFVLWKAYDEKRDGHIFWDTPLGKGRPGWHIECSAMAIDLLGPTIDLHVGGVDNIFPHHENEIAQSEAFSKRQFARYWMHCEHLLVDHKKMSKSLGNFYTLRDLLHKGFEGPEIRYLLLTTHYRTQLNFTFEGLEAARKSLMRLSDFIDRLKTSSGSGGHLKNILQKAKREFDEGLADDLNISVSMAALFELVRAVNILCDEKKLSSTDAEEVLTWLKKIDTVLGFLPLQEKIVALPDHLQALLNKREEARRTKNWPEADAARKELLTQGYIIEDTPQGAKLKKK